MKRVRAALALAAAASFGALGAAAAGPPFPDPVIDQTVYDEAGVWRTETEAQATAIIADIERRSGAEIVAYSQVVDYGIDTDTAERHAIALMDQWGVGREGFDDGLVILFDLDPSLVHGQVQLYAGPGYREAYLSNEDRQRIFEDVMLPYLREEDLDGALLAGLREVDAATTPGHSSALAMARIVTAVVGLGGFALLFGGTLLVGVQRWLAVGRDPELVDSESILLPAPPAGMTPASAATLRDGSATRRALTTAMLDLASRGLISFREEETLFGLGRSKVGIDLRPRQGDDLADEVERRRADRDDLGPAERYAYTKLPTHAEDGYLDPKALLAYGTSISSFGEKAEQHVTQQGWFAEAPSKVLGRWVVRGVGLFVVGVVLIIIGANIPISGLVLAGAGGIAGGIVLWILARAMPARTREGVRQTLMLEAYRRTLQKTMADARSMDDVVRDSGLRWLTTPDRAVVWAVALDLADDVESVLERSVSDLRDGRVTRAYTPAWYGVSGGDGGGSGGSGGGSLFSSSAVPNIGGMFAALGTIGNTPSSSGSGGSGGFSGGSSGGGGGGAGGGF